MKRPLLKILPGVAVVLITPSCSKDNDNIAEDNAALVAEQVKVVENQVFYLKINNATSLSKMTVAGLDEAGEKAFKFEIDDELTITFEVNAILDYSGNIWTERVIVSANAKCINEDGTFKITMGDFTAPETEYENIEWEEAAKVALQEMQDGVFGAASKYNVQLTWGSELDFSSEKYYGYDNLSKMFAAAPRSADRSFTLKQNGDYCFIVFEKGCTKKVTVNNAELSNTSEGEDPKPMCYIVSTDASVAVDGVDKSQLKSGELYYVKKDQE